MQVGKFPLDGSKVATAIACALLAWGAKEVADRVVTSVDNLYASIESQARIGSENRQMIASVMVQQTAENGNLNVKIDGVARDIGNLVVWLQQSRKETNDRLDRMDRRIEGKQRQVGADPLPPFHLDNQPVLR